MRTGPIRTINVLFSIHIIKRDHRWHLGLDPVFTSSSSPEEKTEKVHDYSQKLIDVFKLIFVNPSPKFTDHKNRIIATSFGSSSQYQGIETNAKRIMTRVLKRWNENKSSAHPSKYAITSSKTAALKIYSI